VVCSWFSFSCSNGENNSFDNNLIQVENITHKFSLREFTMFHATACPRTAVPDQQKRSVLIARFRAELARMLAQMSERQ
jgi:hypothetical protein